MSAPTRCQYFERYGDCGRRGLCEEAATLALADSLVRPVILTCVTHAEVIASRYPELGDVAKRFVSIDVLDEFGRLPVPL